MSNDHTLLMCLHCNNICKVKKPDLVAAGPLAEVICKACIETMTAQWKATGVWSHPRRGPG